MDAFNFPVTSCEAQTDFLFSLRRQEADGKEEAATDRTSQVVRGTKVGVAKCQWAFEGRRKITK